MVDIEFYNTKSSNNVINKIKVDRTDLKVTFKDKVDVTRPVIKLELNQYPNWNYCFIPLLKRFYFIENVIILRNNLYLLELKVDVLESFKDDILNSYGDIVQNSEYNKYYDYGLPSEVIRDVLVYNSNIDVEFSDNVILVAMGGEIDG